MNASNRVSNVIGCYYKVAILNYVKIIRLKKRLALVSVKVLVISYPPSIDNYSDVMLYETACFIRDTMK